MLNPYPPSSLVLSTSTTGRSMIALQMMTLTTVTTRTMPTITMVDVVGEMATTG